MYYPNVTKEVRKSTYKISYDMHVVTNNIECANLNLQLRLITWVMTTTIRGRNLTENEITDAIKDTFQERITNG